MPSAPPLSPPAARRRRTVSIVLSLSALVVAVFCLLTIALTVFLTGVEIAQDLFVTACYGIGVVVVLASIALAFTDELRGYAVGTRAPKLLGITALTLAAASVVAAATPIISFLIGVAWVLPGLF